MPFNMWFVPNPRLAKLWPDERERIPFYEQLKQIPEDSYLFEVWARDAPNDRRKFPTSNVQHIANIKANSAIVTSNFGDTRLFFQHEGMYTDLCANPGWRPYIPSVDTNDTWGDRDIPEWPSDREDAEEMLRSGIRNSGCPFAWLFGDEDETDHDGPFDIHILH